MMRDLTFVVNGRGERMQASGLLDCVVIRSRWIHGSALVLCGPFLSIRSLNDICKRISMKGPRCHADRNRYPHRLLVYAEVSGCYLRTDLLSKGGSFVKRAIRKKNE